MILQKEHLVCLSQAVKIALTPMFRPMVCLCLTGEMTVELDMWKAGVPQFEYTLRRPNVSAHIHANAKDQKPIMDRLTGFTLDELSHMYAMERERIGAQITRPNANDATGRMCSVHDSSSRIDIQL